MLEIVGSRVDWLESAANPPKNPPLPPGAPTDPSVAPTLQLGRGLSPGRRLLLPGLLFP